MSLETLKQTGSTHEHVDRGHRQRERERGSESGYVIMYFIH